MLVLTSVNKGDARAEAGGAVCTVYPILICLTVPHGKALSFTSHPAEQLMCQRVTNDLGISLGVSVSPLFPGCGMTQSSIKRGTYRIHSSCLRTPPRRCTCTRRGRRDTCLDSGKGWFRTGHHLRWEDWETKAEVVSSWAPPTLCGTCSHFYDSLSLLLLENKFIIPRFV